MTTTEVVALLGIAATLLFVLLMLRVISRVISWRIALPILAAVAVAVLLGITPAQITDFLTTALIGGTQ